ncbi:MAG: helix-turn-helix domain-containing protein [Clostridia bacterium]|nr:helix-turn-helix domain-containing protein [Clostridia bacterium]
MEVGQKIHSRRMQLGMTQEQLAEAVHVTPQAVSQWETGKNTPGLNNLSWIAHALQMNQSDLLNNEERNLSSWVVHDRFFSIENMYHKLKRFAAAEGLVQMDRAIDFAMEAHSGQLRKTSVFSSDTVPYVFHPFIMTCQAHALGIRDDEVLATSLLHDVCEDAGIPVDKLPFSEHVREAVRLLTKPSPATEQEMDAYYARIQDNATAAIVKVLDRCNNVSTMMLGFSVEKIIEYIDESQKYIYPLIDHIKRQYPEYNDAVFVLKYQIVSVIESAKATILRIV